jgi:hypothetical protein
MDPELFNMVLDTLGKLEKEKLTLGVKLEMDKAGVIPTELIRFMLGPEVALHLIFIPAEYGGLGAGAREIAVISEKMAKMDMAVATSFLAICLGMDPIMVGATPAQREKWVRKIADEGLIVAYGVTEPEAGSNVQSLKTKAERVLDGNGNISSPMGEWPLFTRSLRTRRAGRPFSLSRGELPAFSPGNTKTSTESGPLIRVPSAWMTCSSLWRTWWGGWKDKGSSKPTRCSVTQGSWLPLSALEAGWPPLKRQLLTERNGFNSEVPWSRNRVIPISCLFHMLSSWRPHGPTSRRPR